ncbi:MAG: HNH endonuclease, partial [bacterium]
APATQTAPGTQTFHGAQTTPGPGRRPDSQRPPGSTQTTPGSPTAPGSTQSPPGSSTTQDNPTPSARAHRGRSYLDAHLTDQPPPSDPNRYTPSAALDTYIRLRDRTCMFPGCNQPARYADVDHRIAFAAGGRTTADNLQCLCRHHHRLKHDGGWTIHPNPDHTHTWTSPTGRPYRDNTPAPDPSS